MCFYIERRAFLRRWIECTFVLLGTRSLTLSLTLDSLRAKHPSMAKSYKYITKQNWKFIYHFYYIAYRKKIAALFSVRILFSLISIIWLYFFGAFQSTRRNNKCICDLWTIRCINIFSFSLSQRPPISMCLFTKFFFLRAVCSTRKRVRTRQNALLYHFVDALTQFSPELSRAHTATLRHDVATTWELHKHKLLVRESSKS